MQAGAMMKVAVEIIITLRRQRRACGQNRAQLLQPPLLRRLDAVFFQRRHQLCADPQNIHAGGVRRIQKRRRAQRLAVV